ncbi:glycosyltransferase family 87 protein [Skermanella pratensis]|uniref:glycosyltransferase family 87 protein n=1 Tax=Skermanella pratensis TaxID=2233999 RepID=UPI0017887EAE|nr:glycosyltransferase family 87 protein [Skermanella pratensis]
MGRQVSACFAALLAAGLTGLIVWQLQRSLPGPLLWDFGSFMGSGRAAAEGLDPYGIYPGLTFRVELPGFESWNQNLNPPVSLLLFQPLSQLDPGEAFRLWWAVTVVAYAALVTLLVRHHRLESPVIPALAAFAAAGFWDTLVLGQIYVPLALAATGAWLLLERNRPVAAGLLIGIVVAVKPNFLVWPGLLFLAGHFRAALAAGGCAAVLTAVPALLYGPGIYRLWFDVISQDASRGVFLTNASLPGLFLRFGLGTAGLLVSLVLLAGLAAWALRSRPDPLKASALGLLGALLASPLAWIHYTLFLLPLFFRMPPSPALIIAAILLIIPVPVLLDRFMTAPVWQQATFGSVYAWALLLLLIQLALRQIPAGMHSNEESADLQARGDTRRGDVRQREKILPGRHEERVP